MENYKKEFIEFMLESEVLTFGDFTTKSGRKTPFFINTGKYKTGEQIAKLGEFYAKAISEKFGKEYNVLFGPAYKGIPLVVTTSSALYQKYEKNCEYCFNRKEAKDHGEKGTIVGHKISDNDKIIIVEDVTTAGTSIYETMPLLKQNANPEIVGLIISVNREEKGKGDKQALVELEEKFGFKSTSIVEMNEVIDYLYNKEINGKIYIDDVIMDRINQYYEKYGV